MAKKHTDQFRALVLFSIIFGLILACDSGDDETDEDDPPQTSISRQAVSAVSCGKQISNIVSKLSQKISPIRPTQNSTEPSRTTEYATIDEEGPCSRSGTNAIDMSWDGPEARDIRDCSEVSDLDATLTLTECVQTDEPDITQSLTIEVSKDGSLCEPSRIYASVRDLHIIDKGTVPINLESDSLQIETVDISNSSNNQFMTHVKFIMTGDARGTVGQNRYAAQFDDFVQIVDTDDNKNFSHSFSGKIKSDCMDGWATIETIKPVKQKDSDCPTEGELKVTSGDESTIVVYESDGSVTVGDTSYDSCLDMEENCND